MTPPTAPDNVSDTTQAPGATSSTDVPVRSRICVVDDDRSLLNLLRFVFIAADFDVQVFQDSTLALSEVIADPPNLIVLDLEMPVMNGRAFYRNLRESGNETPVLILSAYGARSAQVELGAQGYVDKPFEPDQLIEATRSLIQ